MRFASHISRPVALFALYAMFVGGAVCTAIEALQPMIRLVTPGVFVVVGLSSVLLSFELNLRTSMAFLSTVALVFAAEVGGTNLGFPFGDYVFTGVMGPKVLEVPLTMPFLWLSILIPSWAAADRFLRYKNVVVASVVSTAADAVVELGADVLDLWHWRGGFATELNFLSWFGVSFLAFSILRTYAREKPLHWLVPHFLIAQLLAFAISDIGRIVLR